MDTEIKEVSFEEVEKKIIEWKKDRKDELESFIGRPVTDITVLAPLVRGLIQDMGAVMAWIEVITHKLKEKEKLSLDIDTDIK